MGANSASRLACTSAGITAPSSTAVTAVVLGAVVPSEVQANHDALFAPTPPELWADLRGVGLLREDAPVPA